MHGLDKLQECKALEDLATLENLSHMHTHLKAGAGTLTAAQVNIPFGGWGE